MRALALAGSILVLSASAAQAMTVREFLTQADHIPHNPTSALRPDARRLIGEVTGAVSTVKSEQAAARRDGRAPATCIPASGTGISPEGLLARLNAIPAARRDISVTQAIREWMIERYPCG
jgi:hypothetical protein